MLKTLSAYIGEYKKVSIKTPIYIIVEVLMEILIPFVTASIKMCIRDRLWSRRHLASYKQIS